MFFLFKWFATTAVTLIVYMYFRLCVFFVSIVLALLFFFDVFLFLESVNSYVAQYFLLLSSCRCPYFDWLSREISW